MQGSFPGCTAHGSYGDGQPPSSANDDRNYHRHSPGDADLDSRTRSGRDCPILPALRLYRSGTSKQHLPRVWKQFRRRRSPRAWRISTRRLVSSGRNLDPLDARSSVDDFPHAYSVRPASHAYLAVARYAFTTLRRVRGGRASLDLPGLLGAGSFQFDGGLVHEGNWG